MREQILFIGGKQDRTYGLINKTVERMEIHIYPKLDLKKLTGIVWRLPQTLKTEIYRRKRFGSIECFCLEGMTDDEILAKIPK